MRYRALSAPHSRDVPIRENALKSHTSPRSSQRAEPRTSSRAGPRTSPRSKNDIENDDRLEKRLRRALAIVEHEKALWKPVCCAKQIGTKSACIHERECGSPYGVLLALSECIEAALANNGSRYVGSLAANAAGFAKAAVVAPAGTSAAYCKECEERREALEEALCGSKK